MNAHNSFCNIIITKKFAIFNIKCLQDKNYFHVCEMARRQDYSVCDSAKKLAQGLYKLGVRSNPVIHQTCRF